MPTLRFATLVKTRGFRVVTLTPYDEGLVSSACALQRLLEICYKMLLCTLNDGYDLTVIRICVALWALIPTFNSAPILR